jgi:hypothetical protein
MGAKGFNELAVPFDIRIPKGKTRSLTKFVAFLVGVMYSLRRSPMHKLVLTPQSQFSEIGYSCQALIARQVNEFLHTGLFYCWFSVQFNPSSGGNSSNPSWLYETLSHAVARNDLNDAKIKDLKTTLMDVVFRELERRGATTQEVIDAIVQIRDAKAELFRPQIWRIFLKGLHGRVSSGHQYPEERKIVDLKYQEFDIIIE